MTGFETTILAKFVAGLHLGRFEKVVITHGVVSSTPSSSIGIKTSKTPEESSYDVSVSRPRPVTDTIVAIVRVITAALTGMM